MINFEVDDGEGTTEISLTVNVPPPAPTGVTLKEDDSDDAEDGDLILSWDDPDNDDINGYEISTDGGSTWTAIADSDSDTVTHTLNGYDVDVELRATNSVGKGESVAFTTPPEAPANLTATAGVRKITLDWDDPDDSNITKYQIHIDTDKWIDIPDSDKDTTSFELTTAHDKEYKIKVRAVSDSGQGAESDEVTSAPPKIFMATVQVEDDQAVTGLAALVDLSRLGTLTLAEAQSIRVYDSLEQTTEYARDIMSATKMAIKINNTTDVYIMYNGTDSDYAATDTYGSEAVYSVLDSSIEGGSLSDRAGNETISEVGTVVYEDNGLWGKAFKIENNDNYPVIQNGDDYTDKISVTLIAKLTNNSGSTYRSLMSAGSSYNAGTGFDFYTFTGDNKWYTDKPGTANEYHTLSDTTNDLDDFTVVQIEKTTTDISISFDGVEFGSVSETGSFTKTDGNIKIGGSTDGSNFIGSIEEVRLSKTTHSAAYKAAEVRNLKDQEAFWGEWQDVTVITKVADNHLDTFLLEIDKKQKAYFEKHGRYFQKLDSDLPDEGATLALDHDDPSDQDNTDDSNHGFVETLPFSVRIDEYLADSESAYLVTSKLKADLSTSEKVSKKAVTMKESGSTFNDFEHSEWKETLAED